MCTRKSKNRSDHATFHDVFIHFEPDEKKEAKRRRLKNPTLLERPLTNLQFKEGLRIPYWLKISNLWVFFVYS